MGDTLLTTAKPNERITYKILLASIKSVMLDYCYLLSQNDWAKIKISRQGFDSIFIRTLSDINNVVPCTMIYKLLSNMLSSQYFPIDRSPGFLRTLIIDFMEELVFPDIFVEQ